MTEYDYSPEAYDRYLATQDRIAKWVDTTERHRPEFQAPFGPGGLQQQQPPAESSSSTFTPTPSRHRDTEEHRSRRHRDGHESLESGSVNSREYGPAPGHTPGYPHQQQQQYQSLQLQQQYASPHVQIYGAPSAVHPPVISVPPHQPMHASYSYAGANSPPSYTYPSHPALHPPPLPSAGDLSHKSNKSKGKRSHSHQPAVVAAAAIAAYYGGTGYTSPPVTHGYHQQVHSGHAPNGGRSGKGGYFVVEHPYQQSGPVQVVPQGQYPPVVPIMYRTR